MWFEQLRVGGHLSLPLQTRQPRSRKGNRLLGVTRPGHSGAGIWILAKPPPAPPRAVQAKCEPGAGPLIWLLGRRPQGSGFCQPPAVSALPKGATAASSRAGRRLQGGGVRGALGKAPVHSTVAQSSEPERPWLRKEVSRIQNRSVFWEVKPGAGDTWLEEDPGLLG